MQHGSKRQRRSDTSTDQDAHPAACRINSNITTSDLPLCLHLPSLARQTPWEVGRLSVFSSTDALYSWPQCWPSRPSYDVTKVNLMSGIFQTMLAYLKQAKPLLEVLTLLAQVVDSLQRSLDHETDKCKRIFEAGLCPAAAELMTRSLEAADAEAAHTGGYPISVC